MIFYGSGVELGLNPLEMFVVGLISVIPCPVQLLKLCLSNKLLLSISPVIAASSNAAITSPRFLNRKCRGFFCWLVPDTKGDEYTVVAYLLPCLLLIS